MVSMLIGLVIIGALVDAVRQHERQQPRVGARQQHDRERPLRDPGAGGRSRARGLLGRATSPMFDDQTAIDVPDRRPRPRFRTPALPTTRRPGTPTTSTNLIGIPVQAYDDAAAADLAVCVATASSTTTRPDTDVLVVRHAEHCVPGDARQLRGRRSPATCTSRPVAVRSTTRRRYVLDTARIHR